MNGKKKVYAYDLAKNKQIKVKNVDSVDIDIITDFPFRRRYGKKNGKCSKIYESPIKPRDLNPGRSYNLRFGDPRIVRGAIFVKVVVKDGIHGNRIFSCLPKHYKIYYHFKTKHGNIFVAGNEENLFWEIHPVE